MLFYFIFQVLIFLFSLLSSKLFNAFLSSMLVEKFMLSHVYQAKSDYYKFSYYKRSRYSVEVNVSLFLTFLSFCS